MNLMGHLQQFGRALMLPTIVLPAAAILLFLGQLPGMGSWGDFLTQAGYTIFAYLPYLFAVGVAMGLTDNAGAAGMSGLLGYLIVIQMTRHYVDPAFDLGVPGGILMGLLAAVIYNRFKNVRLPEYIQFFGGSRIVPMVMSLLALPVAGLFVLAGNFLDASMETLSGWLYAMGGFGAFLYGVLYRLLVPFGLHHILNNAVWFQAGSYTRDDGLTVFGDLPRFFAGDPEAGIYMAGLYPIMMFALPAIALAIVQEARQDLKPKVRATFMTAALASLLTGITEPIEFAFLFVAPYLFIGHAILSGLSMWIAYSLEIRHGFAFSAGAIDYIINLHLADKGLLLLPLGLLYGFLYYILFRWAIRRFQIPTPGREEGSTLEEWAGDIPYRSPLILQALGGKDNIVRMEACITRLRLTLANDKKMDIAALKHLGAAGVIRLGGGNVQVVFGTFSELIREEIMKVIRKDVKQVHFHAPVQGEMLSIEGVPDPVFSGRIAGNGVAFIPERGELVSPVSGKIAYVHPAMHAVGILTKEGLEVLLHIGIDSSHADCFNARVKEGDQVEPGDLLIRFQLQKLRQHCKSPITPMVITNPQMVKSWSFAPFKAVKIKQASVMSVILKDSSTGGGSSHV